MNSALWKEACEILGVEMEGLTQEEVDKAYREAAKECHPDTGKYDAARWTKIRAAKIELTGYLKRRKAALAPSAGRGNCRACGGSGMVQQRSKTGFGLGVRLMCVMCGGSGNVKQKDREE